MIKIANVVLGILVCSQCVFAEESLSGLMDWRKADGAMDLWKGYDSRKDPLETQIVREWKEGDITFRYVVFTIGTFNGKKSRLAAYYAFPKSDKKLPAILHIHGGGQRAFRDEVRNAAKYGYPSLSINHGGEPMEDQQPGEPNTDWGNLDRHQYDKKSEKVMEKDPESPRNDFWFVGRLASLRGLTFLEQQPEVDPDRIGVHGHSVGGRMTVEIAPDPRVYCAVPSCGSSGSYAKFIKCPMLAQQPSNDFAGGIEDIMKSWSELKGSKVRISVPPHRNHRSVPETAICRWLWFEQYLHKTFEFPATPELKVDLKTKDGIPVVTVKPDQSKPIVNVEIYYSIDPQNRTRFWRDGLAVRDVKRWTAKCPIMSTNDPFYAIANVTYEIADEALQKKYGHKQFMISSLEKVLKPEAMQAAGVKATDTASGMIDDFSRGLHDWYTLSWENPEHWFMGTHKIKDPKWRRAKDCKLVVDVKSEKDTAFMLVAENNGWGDRPGGPNGSFRVSRMLKGSPEWQTLEFTLDELYPDKENGGKMDTWEYVTELQFVGRGSYWKDGKKEDHKVIYWNEPRNFRNLRWE